MPVQRGDRARQRPPAGSQMHKELFGVFGGREAFEAHREPAAFDVVLGGEAVTVGLRDPHLGVPWRSCVAEGEDDFCAVWGEAFAPDGESDAAEWLAARYAAVGRDALADLNGSYLAVVEHEGQAVVACDSIRSWECFYADTADGRVFGTDCAAVTARLDDPQPRRQSVLEFLHIGTVLGDKTVHEGVERVPFDGYLTAGGVGEFRRFVYEPREFDYAEELAARLRRAIERRAHYPGRKGLLLSAGQDSRSILSVVPDIDHCYTIGSPSAQEVAVARRLAHQYGAAHDVLAPGVRYLRGGPEKLRYTQGVRESLHIHHAGYDDELAVDTMLHGKYFDTLLKGYFVEHESVGVAGLKLPLRKLATDPDPVDFLQNTLGYLPEGSARLAGAASAFFDDLELDDPETWVHDRLAAEFARCEDRADSVHNATNLLVLRNQPVLDFRVHLADNYLESFVAADRELLEWHLHTPPRYRHKETVSEALGLLDDDIFRHRPPTQPHDAELWNQIERFTRRKLPLVTSFEAAWPDRREIYEGNNLDDHFFPNHQAVWDLPVRTKLRVNDLRWWLS
jgi:asparagine synthetase B (glutamine-hydrolysing)